MVHRSTFFIKKGGFVYVSTRNKLEKLGYSEEVIETISAFRRDRKKRFELRVTDIADLSDHPDKGEFICYACFDTVGECREICEKLEGFAFTLTDTVDCEKVFADGGIIDDCAREIFEELIQKAGKVVTYYWGKAFGGFEDEIVARSYKTENGFKFEIGRAGEEYTVSGMRKFVATRSVCCHSREELDHEVRCLRRKYSRCGIYSTTEEYR